MEDVSMKMGLLELYQLVGDNTGISFLYEGLPGVVVTIGFTLEEDQEDDDGNDDGTDEDDGDESDEQRGEGTGRSFH